MADQTPDGMMRTSGGARIAAYPWEGPNVVLSIQGITTHMTADESHALRDLLQAAELRAARGDVIT